MRYGIGIGCLLVAAISVFVLYPQRLVLEIANANTGQLVLCADMREGEEYGLSFVHSINKRPVYDTLRVTRDHLVIVGSRYDSFGVGMPENPSEGGTFRVGRDGWIEWTINRPMPEVIVRVGWVANHTLRLKGRDIRLADVAEPGTPLAMRSQNWSLFTEWKGRCLR